MGPVVLERTERRLLKTVKLNIVCTILPIEGGGGLSKNFPN
jgi:hypothetical protein